MQAGLGRPAIYKNEAVVDAALGLRDFGRRTIYKNEAVVAAALGLRKGRGWRLAVCIHIQPLRGYPGEVAFLDPALHAGLFMLNP
ncbi:MAG: hypothetical protein R6U62_03070 [Bacteroidales bacterium]